MDAEQEVKSQASELLDETEVLSHKSESVEDSQRESAPESVLSVSESENGGETHNELNSSQEGSERFSSIGDEFNGTERDVEAGIIPGTIDDSGDKLFANPFASGMDKDERLLRVFLLLGVFPLPVVGWILGLFTSFTIKNKRKIHKKLTTLLMVLTAIPLAAGICILGFFLVKSTAKESDKNTPAVTKPEEAAKPGEKLDLDRLVKEVDVEKLSQVHKSSQSEGDYNPVVFVEHYTEPEFKYETPTLKYTPPLVLEKPLVATKSVDDLTFDYFQYKHTLSKRYMVVVLRGLDPSWKDHELFRFSEYIDHHIMVVNVTENSKKKTLSDIFETLQKVFDLKKVTPITLVSDITEEELTKLESTYTTLNIKQIFAINPKMRCLKKEIKEPFVEFVSTYDEKIHCEDKDVDFPTQFTKGLRVKLAPRTPKLGDIKTYFFSNKEECKDSVGTPEVTKAYLDAMFSPLRKFLTATSDAKKDELGFAALCSRTE